MAIGIAESDSEDEEVHDLNVTPFIDVILVLLIIFMVAAPLSTVDLPVDLPSSTAIPAKRPEKPTYVTIKADLSVAVGETEVKRSDLAAVLDKDGSDGDGKNRRIFLRADKSVPYGEMMDVLGILRTAGYLEVALVALETSSPAPAKP
jgi:biopolymer transport protein ExbD